MPLRSFGHWLNIVTVFDDISFHFKRTQLILKIEPPVTGESIAVRPKLSHNRLVVVQQTKPGCRRHLVGQFQKRHEPDNPA